MGAFISRESNFKVSGQTTLNVTLANTPDINIAEYVGLVIFVPTNSPITALTFYVSPKIKSDDDPLSPANIGPPALSYYQLYDPATALPVTATVSGGTDGSVAGRAFDLTSVLSKANMIAFRSLRIVANQVGKVELCMKA